MSSVYKWLCKWSKWIWAAIIQSHWKGWCIWIGVLKEGMYFVLYKRADSQLWLVVQLTLLTPMRRKIKAQSPKRLLKGKHTKTKIIFFGTFGLYYVLYKRADTQLGLVVMITSFPTMCHKIKAHASKRLFKCKHTERTIIVFSTFRVISGMYCIMLRHILHHHWLTSQQYENIGNFGLA